MTEFGNLFAASALPALQSLLGETVTYRSEGAANRSIVAIVDDQVDSQEDANGKRTDLIERLKVKISKDPTEGVASPRAGDSIVRASGLAYAFKGKVLNGNAGCWNLEFERSKPKKFGG